jgi:protein-disulfide isomerase
MATAVVAGLIVLGGVLRKDSPTVQHTASATGFFLGQPDAPVLITAWEDFQCPVCKAANASVLKQIEDEYVSTGKVRIQYRQFPFLGPESTAAAEASQCAADQGKFWDFHDALFNAQRAENSGAYTKANLKKIAAGAGIDSMMFDKCVDESQHKESVQAEKKIGVDLGVNATPTFFVNGTQVKDWRDAASFKALIENALAAAGPS